MRKKERGRLYLNMNPKIVIRNETDADVGAMIDVTSTKIM